MHTWYTRRDIEPVAAWCWWCRKISWAMSLGLWRTSRHPCMIHVSFPTQWRLDQGVRSKRLRKVLHVLLLLACQHFSKRCGSWWCFWWRGFMRGPPPSKFQPQNMLFSQFHDSQVWPGSISSWSLSCKKNHLQKCKLQVYSLYSQRLDSSAVQMACFDSSSTLNPAPKCLCSRWIESVAIKSNELTRQLRKRSQVSLSWYANPSRRGIVLFMRSLGFTGRGESVSLVGKVGDSELLLRCCSYWNTGIAPGIDVLAHLCNQCWWSWFTASWRLAYDSPGPR